MNIYPDIRKGNDIPIEWSFFYPPEGEGEKTPFNLEGKNLSLFLTRMGTSFPISDYIVDENKIAFTFFGKDQEPCGTGIYSLTLCENLGEEHMHTIDKLEAFRLVSRQERVIVGGSVIPGEVSTLEVKPLIIESEVGGDYLSHSDIVDNLVTDSESKALSARQGKVLNEVILAEEARALEAEADLGLSIASKADISTTYTKDEVDGLIEGEETRAMAAEEALEEELEGEVERAKAKEAEIITSLGGKADKSNTYTKAEVDAKLVDVFPDAPQDGSTYGRKDGGWAKFEGGASDAYTKEETDELLSGKEDVIADLETIRNGASLGATALQSIPSTYRTAAQQDAIHDATKVDVSTFEEFEDAVAYLGDDEGEVGVPMPYVEYAQQTLTEAQKTQARANLGVDVLLAGKQDTISDLATIRSGASRGATALQSVPSTYRTAAQQDAIHDATKADASALSALDTRVQALESDYATALTLL